MRLPARATAAILRSRIYWVPAAILIALWLPGFNQGWYRTDTHYYAAVAKQAFDRAANADSFPEAARALLFLKAGDEPYLNKPPLPFWIHGAFIKVFGLHIWSVRLPSLLAAIGAAWCTALAISRFGTRRAALVSVLVLATTVEFFRYTRAISLDLWMLLFMMASVALAAGAIRRGRATGFVWAGVPLGLALMCKPFVGLLAPVLLGAWLVWTGRSRLLGMLFAGVGVALFVAAPWHIAAAVEYPDTFLRTYFIQQSLDRAAGDGVGAGEPWWYYFRLLAQFYWPWLATAALGVILLVRRGLGTTERQRGLAMLALLWTVSWLIALSVFGGKAPRYLVVVFPFLSVLSGVFLMGTPSKAGRVAGRIAFTWGPAVGLVAAVVVACIGVRVHAPPDPGWEQLVKEVDARPGVPLLCTAREHAIAANLVMLGRDWPRVLRGEATGRVLLMVHPTEDAFVIPGDARVVARTREYMLVELAEAGK